MHKAALKGSHLSLQQTRLWSLQGDSSAYCATCAVLLQGPLNMPVLHHALQQLTEQHKIARTTFTTLPGMQVPVQVIHTQVELACPVTDLSDLEPAERASAMEHQLVRWRERSFQLEEGPLLQVEVVILSPTSALLLLALPSLCADATTLKLLVSELGQLYATRDAEQDITPVEERLQYTDVSSWQNSLLQAEDAEPYLAYWRWFDPSRLAAVHAPFGAQASRQQTHFAPEELVRIVKQPLLERIQHCARHHGASIEAFMLACWQSLVWRLTGESESIVGVACDGRPYEELVTVSGPCTRLLPFRADWTQHSSFARLLQQTQQALEEAIDEQEYFTWSPVASEGNAQETPPSFPLCFSYENWPASFAAGSLSLSLLIRYYCIEPFLVQLHVLQVGDTLQVELAYDPTSYTREKIEYMASLLLTLLESAASSPQMAVDALPMLDQAEQQRLQEHARGAIRINENPQPFVRRFEEQVRRFPTAVALLCGEEQATYAQLDTRATQLARYLQKQGVTQNVPVGLCLERSVDMLVGVLAILKAGGAYVPLDPEHPSARLHYQLQDSGITLLLTRPALQSHFTDWTGHIVLLDSETDLYAQEERAHLSVETGPEDLFSLIYTSGSTGKPKGVMIRQSSVLNYVDAMSDVIAPAPGLHFATVSTLAADLGNTAIFCSLLSGGCLHILPYATVTDGDAFARYLQAHPIDVLKIVPSHLNALLASGSAVLPRTYLVLGGEALPLSLWQRIQTMEHSCTVINHYGPTETTIGTIVQVIDDRMAHELTTGRRTTIPIGRPLPNTEAYILDQHLHCVPVGVIGELYIGGAGLASGYLQQPAITAERFITHPFDPSPTARLYKTGDLARSTFEGQIEYIGRADRQIKIRGHRVEPGEIEQILARHPDIWECIVLLHQDEERPADPYLVAYIVPIQQPAPPAHTLRTFLQQQLPEVMIPTVFLSLPMLPLTSNGKVDTQQLPVPQRVIERSHTPEIEPRTPMEELLIGIWKGVLKVEHIGTQDSFTGLGGHSLLATQVISRLRQAVQVEVPLSSMFDTATVAELARLVEKLLRDAQGILLPPMQAVTREQRIPLSYAQQRLWFLEQLEPGSTIYTIPTALSIEGTINLNAFERSLHTILQRHEILRTTIDTVDGQAHQVIHSEAVLSLPIIDISGLSPADREHTLQQLQQAETSRPFDLKVGPLLRTSLLRLSDHEHIFSLTMHHSISDGWSSGIFRKELATLYNAFSTATVDTPDPVLPALPLHYADYACWQRQWLQGAVLEQHLAYWKRQLAGITPLSLPTDAPRPPVQTYRGARHYFRLTPQISQDLKQFSQREGVTLFMLLLAAFQLLLSRYSGQEDIAVGTPIANRTQVEIEEMIGFFVNTLVLRSHLPGHLSFRELVRRVRATTLEAYAHQDIPFEKVVDAVQPERDLSRSPLFQVMFILQNIPLEKQSLKDLHIRFLPRETLVAKFDLTLTMIDTAGELQGALDYNTDLFTPETIAELALCWQTLVTSCIEQPEQQLAQVPLLPAEMHQALLAQSIGTLTDNGPARCIHTLFAEQVALNPESIALVYEDSHITYAALHQRAQVLARKLNTLGVGPETLVGLYLDRSPMQVIALLGVLQAGGAYLPLDPAYPIERIRHMLSDAQVSLVLSEGEVPASLLQQGVQVLDFSPCEDAPQEDRATALSVEHLAYVIYTSGSTGLPRGVQVSHRGIGNLARAQASAFMIDRQSRVLQFASWSFDASVSELWMSLTQGATLVLASAEHLQPGKDLIDVLEQQAITTMTLPPSVLGLLPPAPLPNLQTVIVAGEASTSELLRQWSENRRCYNAYGPTESTVCATIAPFTPAHSRVYLGEALAQTDVYLLDAALHPVPTGVVGELYLGGIGLARGYLNQPAATAERFIPHPCSATGGERLYRTGDLARRHHDGHLEYIGRADQQIKLRGYRIEPGEIEAVLRQQPAVRDVMVIVREDAPGEKRLVAYLIPQTGCVLSPDEIRASMQKLLPQYMVPASLVILDHLPLLPNGKVDRQALPSPDRDRSAIGTAYVAPRTKIEATLASIWKHVLGIQQIEIGVHDNFFALGGDSILSIQVVARATQQGLHLRARHLFQYQTIAQLATLEELTLQPVQEEAITHDPIPLTPVQHWFFSLPLAEPHHFNQVRLLEARQHLQPSLLARACNSLLDQHDALRLHFWHDSENRWQQAYAKHAQITLLEIDLSQLSLEKQEALLPLLLNEAQASLRLSDAPLMRCVLFERGAQREQLLLLVCHHLIIDAISWRFLLEDLQIAYEHLQQGKMVQLPAKTTSFQQWSRDLQQYAQSTMLQQEIPYWQALTRQKLPTLPAPFTQGSNEVRYQETVTMTLDEENTAALIHAVPSAYHTQTQEILLTALIQAFSSWCGQRQLLIEMEGHGREELFAHSDLSRTVGWFTSLFPLLLDLEQASTIGEAIQTVKEQVRRIPGKGLGSGVLRYLHPDETLNNQLATFPEPAISFNYLGQQSSSIADMPLWRIAPRAAGAVHAPGNERTHALSITSSIRGERLSVIWQFSRERVNKAAIVELAEAFMTALQRCINHCQSADSGGYTPSDFPLAGLSQQELDQVVREQLDGGHHLEALYPLAPMQGGLLFHHLYQPNTGAYFEQLSWLIEGDLQVDAWRQAWNVLVERQPVLRTRMVWHNVPHPLQAVLTQVDLPWHYLDWSTYSSVEQEERIAHLRQADQREGFKLEQAPLLRLYLARLDDHRYYFQQSHHHSILDGWSQPLLIKELMIHYQQLTRSLPLQQPPVMPYQHYIEWLSRQDVEQATRFWRHMLQGFSTPIRLCIDKLPDETTSRGQIQQQDITISEQTTAALRHLAQKEHLTMNTLVQGAWALLLSYYSGSEDILFGATVTGRPETLPGVERMIGLFINTLPVRVRICASQPLQTWLQALQEQQGEARQYEYVPLVDIQRHAELPPGQALFETLLVFQNYPVEPELQQRLRDAAFTFRPLPTFEQTHYPMMLKATARGSEMRFYLQYDTAHYADEAIAQLLVHLRVLLEQMAARPEQPIIMLSPLTPAEQQHMVETCTGTTRTDFVPRSLPQIVTEQETRIPDAIAVVAHDEALSYAELERRANQLAHLLCTRGIQPETAVGVCMDRSLAQVIAIVAILKAGAAYLPLDPQYPGPRLHDMIEQSGTHLIITDTDSHEKLPTNKVTLLILNEYQALVENQPVHTPIGDITMEHPAYIIYTSGSTGQPKGIEMPHRALSNLLDWQRERSLATVGTRTLQFTSISFDVACQEYFATWASGGTLYLIDEQQRQDPQELLMILQREAIERLFVPFVALQQLAVAVVQDGIPAPDYVREVITAGEQLQVTPALRQFFAQLPAARLYNQYGPAESHVVSEYQLDEDVTQWPALPPVGRPVANTELLLLDAYLRVVPAGVIGEIYIGGIALARGYRRRPDLTAERFVPHPYSKQPGQRLYRTGDLGRYRADGMLEFVGRRDHQVKLRGYRIEPGEIEAVLHQQAGIRDAAVVLQEDERGNTHLAAYVIAEDTTDTGTHITAHHLRAALIERLPVYMVPARIQILEQFPFTPSGKVDRLALSRLDAIPVEVESTATGARTPVEEILLEIWSQVLGQPTIGLYENFFTLGGHSLLATQVMSRIRTVLQVELPLRDLFEQPTVAALARRIDAVLQHTQVSVPPVIHPVPREQPLPLSFAQQRLWFLNQFDPASTAYNIPLAWHLEGSLDIQALERSFIEIVHRHEVVRTTFASHNGMPVQVITTQVNFSLPLIDLREIDIPTRETTLAQLVQQEGQLHFDLASQLLLRATLVQLESRHHVMLVSMHHIVSDGWSMGLFTHELTALYNAFTRGDTSPLPQLTVQYADFAAWQQQWLQGEVLQEQLHYWREQLHDLAPLHLPADYPRPAVQRYQGAHTLVWLPQALSVELKHLGQREGTTLFMTLLTAFMILLARYSGQEDIAVGTPIANRKQPEVEQLIGFFVNTLVLRADLSGNPTFTSLLRNVREVTLEAYAHQDIPFEKLVEVLQPQRDMQHSPLFQVMFILQNTPRPTEEMLGLARRSLLVENYSSKFDLTVSVTDTPQGMRCTVEYSTDLFTENTIARLLGHWQHLLEGIVAHPEQRLHELPLVTPDEQEYLLYELNKTHYSISSPSTIQQLFDVQVERMPDAIAVVYEDTVLSYSEVQRRANQLAHFLRATGVGPEVLVGLEADRSHFTVIGLLAILKAGGAYVPLDPSYPRERLDMLIADAAISILLTQGKLQPTQEVTCITFQDAWATMQQYSEHNPESITTEQHLAYVLYTSGSTGKPKGVCITHHNLLSSTLARTLFYPDPVERFLLLSSFAFDSSVAGIFWTLTQGGTLIIPSTETVRDLTRLAMYTHEAQITHLLCVPSLYTHLLPSMQPQALAVSTAIVAGEHCSASLVQQHTALLAQTTLYNEYGPTEATVWSSATRCYAGQGDPGIGRPIANVEFYILDQAMQLLPQGIPGELFVAGDGVARGYLHRSDITAERFLPHPWSTKPGARLYRTGDLVRYRADGSVEFLGRLDQQVKVRGYRIELEEIEGCLRQQSMVRDGVVTVANDAQGNVRLVAYVIAHTDHPLDVQVVRTFLQQQLPDYMVPALFIELPALPLLANGKVDRRALSTIDQHILLPIREYQAPRTSVEQAIATIWSEILGIERIGITDNFFELGGHSLLVTRVISRVRDTFQLDIPLRLLFDTPTIERFAQAIQHIQQESTDNEVLAQLLTEIENLSDDELHQFLHSEQ